MTIAVAILARAAKAAITLLLIVILNFFLIHAAPGDPAMVMAGEAGAADEQFIQQLREQFGLDQPLSVQFWNYVSGVLQLDLGYSYRQQMPVLELILDRLPDLSVRMRFSNNVASQFKFQEVYVVQERDGLKLAGIR